MALQESVGVERIAVKAICVSDLLKNMLETARDLDVSHRRITCYVRQANLLLMWRQGNAAMKLVGSTVKTVGMVTAIASAFNPRLKIAATVGGKLWRFGAGLKILSCIANVLKELWQKGCRSCLLDFVRQTALLVKNLRVFNELVGDLRQSVSDVRVSHRLDTPEQVWNVVSHFVPASQRVYMGHILCIVTGCQNYSPLFDFAALVTDPSNDSHVLQLMREVESFQFFEFVQQSDSNIYIGIGSILHVTRELLDFLDGFQKLTNQDCVFLQQCLTKFTEESIKIKTFVTFLKSLNDVRSELNNVKQIDPERIKDVTADQHDKNETTEHSSHVNSSSNVTQTVATSSSN